jgi:creatinine amidohydrolase/Fe(II)-dependent formamide hydrolase-like protein
MKKVILGSLAAFAVLIGFLASPLSTPLPNTVHLEDMTWLEVREAVSQGKTAVIIPTAGVEQNGPDLVLGKHRHVVRHTAGRVATELGDALVAPVIDFVPEGNIDPPSGHMKYHGTISVPAEVFSALLKSTIRSLAQHGFTRIYLVGDSLGNQKPQSEVATQMNVALGNGPVTVFHIGDYYGANGQGAWLKGQGESDTTIGTHAGIRDTSEMLVVFPEGVRTGMMKPKAGFHLRFTGANGDPTQASLDIGRKMLDLKVQAALRQIRQLTADNIANP